MSSDVLVIGGGVIGLSIVRELRKQGVQNITLIERSVCGSEASWAAAGMLGPQAEGTASGSFFEMCRSSRDLYPQFADELLDETGINIELDRAGTLCLAFDDEDIKINDERFKSQRLGGLEVERLSAEETRRVEPFVSPDVRESLYFAGDWQVDNRKLCSALAAYARANGVEIQDNRSVEKLIVDDGRVIGVETDTGRVEAGITVVATGAWTSLIKLGDVEMPFKVEPVRGQMIAFHTAKRLFERVIYSQRGYIVPRADGRIIAGSTTERVGFDRSVTNEVRERLRDMACEIAPSLAGLQVADNWAGLRPFAVDGLPIIGPIDGIDGLFIAAAHYRNGILLAPITAKLAAAHLVDGAAPFSKFDIGRFRLRSVGS